MGWDASKPIKKLPSRLEDVFSKEAQILYNDLEGNRLEVKLIPAPDPQFLGHMIRVAESENPAWYRELYHSIDHFRRDRSIASLIRIYKKEDWPAEGFPFCNYDYIYRSLILRRLVEGYDWYGCDLPPHSTVLEAVEAGKIYYEIKKFESNPFIEIPF